MQIQSIRQGKEWKKMFLILVLCFSFQINYGQWQRSYTPLVSDSKLMDKNVYLLTLLQQVPGAKSAIMAQPLVRSLFKRKNQEAKSIDCKTSAVCIARSFLWKPQEIDSVGEALAGLANTNPSVQKLITAHMRPSGYFILHEQLNNAALLKTAWTEAMQAINNIIEVYGTGRPPLYPAIDSVSYDVRTERYGRLMTIVYQKDTQTLSLSAQFVPSVKFALDLLEINNRDEAARFEPMEQLENKAAVNFIKTINWEKYPYSLILVPGAGNDLQGVALAAWGKMRLDLAVQRYRNGEAPVIAVSGGFVHPFQTPFCEAVEMKKYLMQRYQIPEKAILIEPHARHTTTNIRNVNRLIFEYGMPQAKRVLIVTDPNQSAYIESNVFYERSEKEMKALPFTGLKRLSSFDLSYLPVRQVLYRYAMDPLDP